MLTCIWYYLIAWRAEIDEKIEFIDMYFRTLLQFVLVEATAQMPKVCSRLYIPEIATLRDRRKKRVFF